jgi:hypothetical protein
VVALAFDTIPTPLNLLRAAPQFVSSFVVVTLSKTGGIEEFEERPREFEQQTRWASKNQV